MLTKSDLNIRRFLFRIVIRRTSISTGVYFHTQQVSSIPKFTTLHLHYSNRPTSEMVSNVLRRKALDSMQVLTYTRFIKKTHNSVGLCILEDFV